MMYDKNNIFARIIRGELPCAKIYEDDKVLAFNDISPAAPVHILVIPKQEGYTSFEDFVERASPEEVSDFFRTVNKIARNQNMAGGYRIITNIGALASQTIFHFHVHILGGRELGGLLAANV